MLNSSQKIKILVIPAFIFLAFSPPLFGQPSAATTNMQEVAGIAKTIFIFVVGGGLLTLVGTYIACLSLSPELIVSEVKDKNKNLNSESRIAITNTGRLPALDIQPSSTGLSAEFRTMRFEEGALSSAIDHISRLAHGETAEIPACGGIEVEFGGNFDRLTYELTLDYKVKLLFTLKKSKSWRVTLKTTRDGGFHWIIT